MRAALALLAFAPTAALAQPVRVNGAVRDALTEAPVPGAEVTLAREDGRRAAAAISDSAGAFTLRASGRGRYSVSVRRIGYEPARTATFDPAMIADGALEVRLQPTVQLLDTVTASVPVPQHLVAFERRRQRNTGTFFTRDDIARRGDPPLLDLLRAAPGVLITGSGRTVTVSLTHSPNLRNCQPVLFLDGVRTNRSADSPDRVSSLLQSLSARTVDGVEVYSGLSRVPAELGGSEARCGAIAVWTRTVSR